MTQVIFPTIVYRQIISLIIHCFTIPVGQKFTYTELTAWKIPENHVIALEASIGLLTSFKPVGGVPVKLCASLLDIMGKSKQISQDLRKYIVDLHKSGSSLRAISKCLKVPRLSVKQ